MLEKYSDITSKGKLINNEAVEQSIDNILSLNPFDVFFNKVGAGIDKLLFKVMSKATSNSIYFVLITAIEQTDDRVIIDKEQSYVNPDYDKHYYDVKLIYKIKGLDDSMYTYNRRIKVKYKEGVENA